MEKKWNIAYSIKTKKKVVMVQKLNIEDSPILGTKTIDIYGNMRRSNFNPFF